MGAEAERNLFFSKQFQTAYARRNILLSHPMQALEKYNIEKDIAAFIKKEFDKKYP